MFWEQYIDEIEISPFLFSDIPLFNGFAVVGEFDTAWNNEVKFWQLVQYSTELCASTGYTFHPWTTQINYSLRHESVTKTVEK